MDKKELLILFDISDDQIDTFTIDLINNIYFINIRFKKIIQRCPNCNGTYFIKKGKTKRILSSNPINNLPCKLITYVSRYECKECNKTFNDKNPIVYEDWAFTRPAIITILNKLKPYTATYSAIAREYDVSVTRVIEIFDAFVRIERHTLPKVLLIDEYKFTNNIKYKYPALLMNFENNLIVDIVESRTHDIMCNYFFNINKEERDRVEYICTDMSFTFKPLCKTFFPSSTLLVDHFHVTKLVNDQLNNTRKRIMRKYSNNKRSIEYRILKHRYRLLLCSNNLVDNEKFYYDAILNHHTTANGVLEYILSIDDELKLAYDAKEEYLAFDQVTKEEIVNQDKRKELESLIKKFRHTNVEECISVADTFLNWKEEILNSFTWIGNRRISNGPIEGKNNYIKKILSNGNGLKNFKRSRNRIMYSQNKYEAYTLNVKSGKIKEIGKPRGSYKKK